MCASNTTGSISFNAFFSTDNGETWNEVDSSLTNRSFSCFTVSGSSLFTGGLGVFRSTDNGLTWISVLADIPVEALGANEHIVLAGTVGNEIWRSIDNGANWTKVRQGSGGAISIESFAFLGNTIFIRGLSLLRGTEMLTG